MACATPSTCGLPKIEPGRRLAVISFWPVQSGFWILVPRMTLRRYRPYFHYVRAVRGQITAAIVYGDIYGLTSGFGLPSLIKYVFPPIFDHEGPPLDNVTVWLIAGSVPLIFLLRAVSGYLNSYYVQLAGVRILEALRLDYFKKLQLLPLSFVQRKQTGDLISRGLSDTAQLQFAF